MYFMVVVKPGFRRRVPRSAEAWLAANRGGQSVGCLALLVLVNACGPQPANDRGAGETSTPSGIGAAAFGDIVVHNVARIRHATAEFRSLDAAVRAGYARDGGHCVDNPREGAMGYHHQNAALLDDRIELERPEMLVYERLPDGEYRLTGVEYVVPLSEWPETREPPTVMGQELKPAPSLGIWYRHVWLWRENPSGLFADWNPLVEC
jgi:hypothetical protein